MNPGGARRWVGPVLLLAGFLLATLGGLRWTDCFLCTWAELLSAAFGALTMLVGAALTLFRRDRRAYARAVAVALLTTLALAAALTLRVALAEMLWAHPPG